MSTAPDAAPPGGDPTSPFAQLPPEQQAALIRRMEELGPEGLAKLMASGGAAAPTEAPQPREEQPAAAREPARAVAPVRRAQPIGGERRGQQPAPRESDPYAALDVLGAGFHALFATKTPIPVYGVSLVATADGWTVAAQIGEGEDGHVGRQGGPAELGAALREVMREIMMLGGQG